MATSAVMQSIPACPVTRVTNRTRSTQTLPSMYVPRLPRNTSMQVRCMAKPEDQKEQLSPSPKVSTKFAGTKFAEVFAFSGPAPETINGRLAMIGFVAAMAVELSNGQGLFAQISNGGIPWFLGTSILLSVASLIPLFKGVSVESKSERVFSSEAEMLNGRAAMLGLVALAFTEFVKGAAIVV